MSKINELSDYLELDHKERVAFHKGYNLGQDEMASARLPISTIHGILSDLPLNQRPV